jgi:hypothetical protein
MYLMFGDEADKDQTAGKKFFIYGAIWCPSNSLCNLHAGIETARKAAGYAVTDSLKSSSNSRPTDVAPEKHRELKNEVMNLAREVGNVRFCAQATLHEIARNQPNSELVERGANTVLSRFDTFLKEQKSFGYALMDRMPIKDPYKYLKDKFQLGMEFPDKPSVRFDRIIGLGHACDGSSNLCSVADIMLGAFRYCVNEPENPEAGKAMFPTLMSMMWKREQGGKTYVNECGLVFRPKELKVEKHRAEYEALIERLQGYLG